jgi:general secretion pathway protein K
LRERIIDMSIHAQRGIALVLVLWAVTLLTVIAGGFAFSMRTSALVARNQAASAQSEALADAGVQRALYELFKPASDTQRWQGNGATHPWEFGGARIDVTIQDISGKIDLNTAVDDLLRGLLKNAGLNDEQTSAMLDAILDWRDEDDLRRPNGAEASDYQAAGLHYKPANAPFTTVDELRQVLGMTPDLYARVADALTVDSHQSGVNAAIASRQVLLALPGADAASVDAYMAERQAAWDSNQVPPPFPPAAALLAGNNGSVYSVRAEAVQPDGAAFIRVAVVSINPSAVRKVAFLSWKEGEATPKTDNEEAASINDR